MSLIRSVTQSVTGPVPRPWISGGAGSSGFNIIDADGTNYLCSLQIIDADGTSYTVTNSIIDADGTSYTVI